MIIAGTSVRSAESAPLPIPCPGWLVMPGTTENLIFHKEQCKETREKFSVLYKEYLERINSIESPNVPLTWEELRKMESKPIWIEQNMMIDFGTKDEYRQTKKEWVIVVSVDNRTAYLMSAEDGELCFVRAEYFDNPDLTDYWQAYRKERL